MIFQSYYPQDVLVVFISRITYDLTQKCPLPRIYRLIYKSVNLRKLFGVLMVFIHIQKKRRS